MTVFYYALAGGVATAVHYAVLILLVERFGVAAAVASAVGALCGALLAYLLNRRLTFSATAVPHRRAVALFMAVAGVGALLNGALVWLGVHTLAWHYLLAQGLATLLVFALTYRLNKHWTFAL